MSRFIANFISYIFHPLLFPTFGTAAIIFSNPHLFGNFDFKQQSLWVILVFVLTFVFPSVWLLMMRKLQMIDSLKLETTKERIIPYIATATFYLWTYRMFHPTNSNTVFANELISSMMLGAAIAIFIGFFINIFQKISLHAIGAGCFFGLALVLVRFSDYNLMLLLIASVLIGGMVGSARLILNAHEPKDIFMGYFVGFAGQFLAFNVIPMFG
jgi:hypothetical protein